MIRLGTKMDERRLSSQSAGHARALGGRGRPCRWEGRPCRESRRFSLLPSQFPGQVFPKARYLLEPTAL